MTDQMKKARRKHLKISSLWKFYFTGKISLHLLCNKSKTVFANSNVIQIRKQCFFIHCAEEGFIFLTGLIYTEKNLSVVTLVKTCLPSL